MYKEWDYTRKSYIKWLSKTSLRKEFAKKIKFDDFSLWWISNLNNKDNRNNTKWYINLNNKLNSKINNQESDLSYFKLSFILFKKFISAIFSNIIIRLVLSDNFHINIKKNKHCFYTLVNNFVDYKKNYLDRQYGLTSIKKKIEKSYIIEVPQGFFLLKDIFQIKKKIQKTCVEYLILNSKYDIKDILNVYSKTFMLLLKTLKILRKSNFFIIEKKDCRMILEKQLISSFFGNIQDQLLKGLALEKSLKIIKPKNFITYFCFYPEARMQYYFAKKSKVKNIINVNHAIYTKQNIYWNFYKKEFSSNQSNFFSPKPDIFICKGKKEYRELKKIFKTQKFYFSGDLKSDIRNFFIKKMPKQKINRENKVITVLLGETDYQGITKILNECKLNQYTIYIQPFPFMKQKQIDYLKKNLIHKFKVVNMVTKNDLFKISDFILFGETQLGTELAIKNYNVIRIYEKNFIPQYDLNDEFPYACDGNKLQNLLKEKKHKFRANLLEKDYFFKYDFKASDRFQIILDKL